ncbi:MAG: hypothetical protein AAFU79_14245 [Myxococcota bacterium]
MPPADAWQERFGEDVHASEGGGIELLWTLESSERALEAAPRALDGIIDQARGGLRIELAQPSLVHEALVVGEDPRDLFHRRRCFVSFEEKNLSLEEQEPSLPPSRPICELTNESNRGLACCR